MSEFTPVINKSNIDAVRHGISLKQGYKPFQATQWLAEQTYTDFDMFPYQRWYRGIPQSSEPVVAEREAGQRIRNDACYRVNRCRDIEYRYPQHCFETACSTVFPCTERDSKLIVKPACVPVVP